MTYETWVDIMRVVSCVAALAFAITYGVTAPWWRSAVSRNIMTFMSAIGLFLMLAVIQMIRPAAFTDWPWLRPVVWTIIALLLIQRFVILIRTQVLRRSSHDHHHSEEPHEDLRT